MSDMTSFTIKYNNIVDRLIFPCVIAHNHIVLKTYALIDTGAMSSYVSSDLSTTLNLLKTGQAAQVVTSKPDGVFPIVKAEYLGVHKNAIFNNCTFIAKPFADDEFGIILGMDFLRRGDFILSNLDNCTTTTIQRPSQSIMEYSDNIVDEKDIPQLIERMRHLRFDTFHIDS